MRFRTTIVILVLFIAACQRSSQPESSQPTGIDVAGMDRTVKAGDDFNKYTNGHWLQTTEIPADKPATVSMPPWPIRRVSKLSI
jgi:hypothetical protein